MQCAALFHAGKVTEKVGQMFKEDGSVGHQFTPDGAAGETRKAENGLKSLHMYINTILEHETIPTSSDFTSMKLPLLQSQHSGD
jgi:hypothetical protein